MIYLCNTNGCGPSPRQCSSYCNDRHQTRHVRCLAGDGDGDKTCNPLTRPTPVRACSPGTCNNVWRTRSWGEVRGITSPRSRDDCVIAMVKSVRLTQLNCWLSSRIFHPSISSSHHVVNSRRLGSCLIWFRQLFSGIPVFVL